MIADMSRTEADAKDKLTLPLNHLMALLLGMGLGTILTLLFPHFSGLAALALWPLGLAGGLLTISLYSSHRRQETLWGFALVGQLLAVVGIALIFLASIF